MLATAASTIEDEGCRRAPGGACHHVWLYGEVAELAERAETEHRPLTDDVAGELSRLGRRRDPLYAEAADLAVDVTANNPSPGRRDPRPPRDRALDAVAEGAQGVEVGAGVGGAGHAEHPTSIGCHLLPIAAVVVAATQAYRTPHRYRAHRTSNEGASTPASTSTSWYACSQRSWCSRAQVGRARVAEVDRDVADPWRAADDGPVVEPTCPPSSNWLPAWVSPWISVCSPSSQISVIRSWCST